MYCLRFAAFFLILAPGLLLADEQPPEWSYRTYSAPADPVFAAALKSIAAQHHEVKSNDETNHVVSFHVGVTAWSWGYNMILKVTPAENDTSKVSIEIARSGGKTVSWGSGRKEVEKIFAGIEKELAKADKARAN